MRLLADTHAIYWFLNGNLRLPRRARSALEDTSNDVFVSVISGYEIALKAGRGRMHAPFLAEFEAILRKARFAVLPLTLDTAVQAGNLPGPHGDPWDRVLIAHAKRDGLTVVTIDSIFRDYGVPVLW